MLASWRRHTRTADGRCRSRGAASLFERGGRSVVAVDHHREAAPAPGDPAVAR
ncbi:MAG TPA: hypothetical protein VM263_03515 [Acidimicrobiales bacterium]|nr:hypothetical protein [Acidimicrobiales bacterium]